MGRTRSPDSIEAQKLYKSGMKIVDIAEKIGVPSSTVRRWKATQDWDGTSKKKQTERSDKISERSDKISKRSDKISERSEIITERKRVKPKAAKTGSKRAPGGGVKPGTKNALEHGGYSAVWWDMLDDDERELLENMPVDEEKMLEDEITLYKLRERRIMKAINMYKDSPVYLATQTKTEVKRTFKDDAEKEEYERRIQEKVEKGERLPGEPYNLQSETESTARLINNLERELTTVQNRMDQAIDSLAKLRLEKKRMEGDTAQNEVAQKWAEKIKAMRG